ncbi:MAG TPA: hypothetical protein DCW29_23415 [Janthinobacterium sp.]|nr:hypothetical protein [Janthinobacterium sp.]
MDRRAAILRLRQDLLAAGADWTALGAAQRALAREMPALAARGPWSEAERAAMLALRATHEQSCRLCAQEQERLALHLDEIQANQEGWIAYALFGDMDMNGYQS